MQIEMNVYYMTITCLLIFKFYVHVYKWLSVV